MTNQNHKLDLLNFFTKPIEKKYLEYYFKYLKGSVFVGGIAGFFVGRKLGNPLAGTVLGSVTGVLVANKSGHATGYASRKTKNFRNIEHQRLVDEISGKIKTNAQVISELKALDIRYLYGIDYFFKNPPQNIHEQSILNVMLNEIKEKNKNLFEALKND